MLLTKIRLDGDTQPRVEIDLDVVQEYADAYEADATMPPLVVFFDGTDYWLADGFHRWHAARKAKLDKVSCEVRQGTKEDARWFSYAANQTHGVRRTNPDKAKAVKAALLHPNGAKMSDSQIAEYLGVNDKTVAKYRAELVASSEIPKIATRVVKRGGQEYEQNTANIGKRKCRNCGGADFDDDGDCLSCREPKPSDDPPESPTMPQDASDDEEESEAEEAEGIAGDVSVPHKEPFGEQLWLVVTRFWTNQYPEVPPVTVADYLEEMRDRVLRGER